MTRSRVSALGSGLSAPGSRLWALGSGSLGSRLPPLGSGLSAPGARLWALGSGSLPWAVHSGRASLGASRVIEPSPVRTGLRLFAPDLRTSHRTFAPRTGPSHGAPPPLRTVPIALY